MLAQYQLSSAMLSLTLSLGNGQRHQQLQLAEPHRPTAIFDDGDGSTMYLAAVSAVGGEPNTRILRWTGRDWQQIGPALDGRVLALCAFAGELYAGGEVVFGSQLANLARWDGGAWRGVGAASTPDGPVDKLTVFKGRLYVAGDFTRIGKRPADHVARWDGHGWEGLLSREKALRTKALPDELAGSHKDALASTIIYDLERFEEGNTASWVAAASQGILRWDGANWSRLATVLFGEARAVKACQDHLYAAATSEIRHPGALTTVYGHLARYDGRHWHAVPNAPTGAIYALAAGSDGKLYVGGSFSCCGRVSAHNIACWDGKTWSNLGAGLPGRVAALAMYQGRLHAAGHFAAGAHGSTACNSIAVWDNHQWTLLGGPGRRDVGLPAGVRDHRLDMANLLPRRSLELARSA